MSHPPSEAGSTGVQRPVDWDEAIDRILAARTGRVMILGPRDAGKSTFATEVLRACHRSGRPAALLDLDVGQKMVGPPACVTLGRTRPHGGLDLAGLAFVGATDPVRGWRETIRGAVRLSEEASDLVVNTGGLLAGPGRRLKTSKIQALAPDLLVGIGADPDLDAVLEDHGAVPALRIAPSPLAVPKTEGARRAARREAFRACFADARERTEPLHAFEEDAPGGLPQPSMLIALADSAGRDLGLGLVTGFDPEAGTLTFRTPALQAEVSSLRGSRLVLDDTYGERRLPVV